MKINGIEMHMTANMAYNLSLPIGLLINDSKEDNLVGRIKEALKNGDKLYFVSPNDERMKAAQKLIDELP